METKGKLPLGGGGRYIPKGEMEGHNLITPQLPHASPQHTYT